MGDKKPDKEHFHHDFHLLIIPTFIPHFFLTFNMVPKEEDVGAVIHAETRHVKNHMKGGEDFIEDSAPGLFLNLCVVATAIGGMLFGYDTGVISGVLVVLGTDLDGRLLSHGEKELITSLCAAGALIGAIIAGVTADKYGRKPAIWFASVLFTIGALVQATSYSLVQMCVGRVLVGLGVGSASMVCSPPLPAQWSDYR